MNDSRNFEPIADLLDYPSNDLSGQVKECMRLFSHLQRGSELLKGFSSFVDCAPISRLEEVYTSTFDLQPVCCLYVGHHLFGEGPKRGLFMAGLKEHYELCDFSSEKELPDHLGVMLRFIAGRWSEEKEMISECVVPALKKMLEHLAEGINPYKEVLSAILLYLEEKLKAAG